MMITDALDPHVVSKPILQQIEQVTCIECCKYYIAPKTAPCGHSLCHVCWSGRRSCPTCGVSVTRKSLRLNLQLQNLTDHVHILGEAFEKLFNVKLEDFTLNMPEMQSESDPTKNVKEWLASSENHFSAPVSSQQSQDIVESVELSNSKIQIHEIHQKKETTTDNKISSKNTVPQKSQEDWDKIEILPDSEDICVKDKENIVGPMDIEPFYFEDNEYTTDHPRRSSRKRELKNDSTDKGRELSVEKQSSKNSGSDSKKVKQNWGNVKKMKKEFSKLNRNKSKLNVSIEMFKKSQNSANKPVAATCQSSSPKPVEIDDNTPNINVGKEVDSLYAVKTNEDKENNGGKPQETIIKESNSNSVFIDDSLKKLAKIGINKNKINDSDQDHKQGESNKLQNKNIDINKTDTQNISNKKATSEPVIKKSDLHQSQSQNNNCIKITQKDVAPDFQNTSSPDDIEISIKIGSTVTNIVIKNKQNDVQLKIKSDQEIQTSLGPYGITNKRDVSCSAMQVDNDQNIERRNNTQEIEIQLSKPNEKNNDKIDETQVAKLFSTNNMESADTKTKINAMQAMKSASTKINKESADTTTKTIMTPAIKSASTKKNMESVDTITKTIMTAGLKSASTKKNTESADTATANFEITESVEKELSDIMDCVETNAKDEDKTSSETTKKQKSKIENTETDRESNYVHEEMELINDLDIFNSGSVKEVTVKSLRNAKAHSEILVPTNKSKKSQKIIDKRDRETNDEEMPQNKKQKVDSTADRIDKGALEEANKNVGNDSEHMNYDAIISQVFANIDADMKSKTQSLKTSDDKNEKNQYNVKPKATDKLGDIEKDVHHQKYSENIFSIMDKDSEVIDVDISNNTLKQVVEPDSTQKRIENLLTPGMCRDLASDEPQGGDVEPMDIEMGTPLVDDDSDKSVVEETPQKNVSFTKLKQRTDSTNNKDKEESKEKSTAEKASNEKNNDSQIIKSIINISDTEESDKLKDVTVVNMPRKTLETPLTINKFVGHIKHNSTPVARKSLNFESENDPEQTLCPTTTQEKEFMAKAFEQTPKAKTPVKRPLGLKNVKAMGNQKFCLAGSCLTAAETVNVKLLCFNNGWTYVDKYTKDITHLVVGVDDENKSQRSVKYMCALAASKWIVSYDWVEKCLITKEVLDEVPYEALDACGEPGPMLSRIAPRMLFEGISFYCLSPFTILDVETLKYILEAAGGRVVSNVQGVRVTADSGPALLLAEPEHTQEDRFIYLALQLSIVPVNYEWVLNCLGSYSLGSICDQLLCPMSILSPVTKEWPAALMQRDSQEEDE